MTITFKEVRADCGDCYKIIGWKAIDHNGIELEFSPFLFPLIKRIRREFKDATIINPL